MKLTTSDRLPQLFRALLLTSILIAGAGRVRAQVFTIDTNQSSVTISGSVLGSSIGAQAAGSLTATVGGTIQAAVTGSGIQFTGGSLIQANDSGSWQPNADGTAGSQPADFGGSATTPLGLGLAALRNILLDVTSGVIPIAGGQFDSSSLTFFFPSNATSSFAYNVSGGFLSKHGAQALTGYATNKVTALATLTAAGSQTTLVLPVNATFYLTLVSPNDTVVTLSGQLVATQSGQAPLIIQSAAVQNHTLTLQWQGGPGQQFKILSSANLSTWQTNPVSVTPTNGTYTWTTPATAPVQFLRLAQ